MNSKITKSQMDQKKKNAYWLEHLYISQLSQSYLGWVNFMGTNWVKESCPYYGVSFCFLKWFRETLISSAGDNGIHSSSPTHGKWKKAFISENTKQNLYKREGPLPSANWLLPPCFNYWLNFHFLFFFSKVWC